ncbi:hypothetical protein D3C85_1286300 [compost metagenome]
MGARRQAAQQRLEKFAQLLQRVAVGQVTGIEYHGLDLRPQASHPRFGLEVVGIEAVKRVGQARGNGFDLARQWPATQYQGTFDRAQAAGLPALQRRRAWQAKGIHKTAAEVGVGKAEVAIAHEWVSRKASLKVWTNFVARSFECGKNT